MFSNGVFWVSVFTDFIQVVVEVRFFVGRNPMVDIGRGLYINGLIRGYVVFHPGVNLKVSEMALVAAAWSELLSTERTADVSQIDTTSVSSFAVQQDIENEVTVFPSGNHILYPEGRFPDFVDLIEISLAMFGVKTSNSQQFMEILFSNIVSKNIDFQEGFPGLRQDVDDVQGKSGIVDAAGMSAFYSFDLYPFQNYRTSR